MRAGEVTSSYPISLLKAATVLSRFSASDTGARPEVTAYLMRSLTAFKELVAVHRDIRAHRKISHVEEEECASKNDDNRHTTKKKKRKGNYYEVEAHAANSVLEQQEEMGGSSKKKMEALDSGKNSEERRHWKENKRKEYRLPKNGRVGFVSESMNTERKKRKLSDAGQGKVDKEMDQHEGKKKKKRTIELKLNLFMLLFFCLDVLGSHPLMLGSEFLAERLFRQCCKCILYQNIYLQKFVLLLIRLKLNLFMLLFFCLDVLGSHPLMLGSEFLAERFFRQCCKCILYQNIYLQKFVLLLIS